jgi:hypothetical protein
MSLFDSMFGWVDPSGRYERLKKERDALKQEVEMLLIEYNVLKDQVVKLMMAHRDLIQATEKLRQENMLLKQAIVVKTHQGGVMQ